MDEQPREEGELPEPLSQADEGKVSTGSEAEEAPAGPEARALAMEAEEIRRLVEAGAGSPEAIRELAARLREHREREEALWRAEIKPALVKEGKGRLRGHTRLTATSTPSLPERESPSNVVMLGLLALALVVVVVVAASTTVWLLILPVLALIVWAWNHGRHHVG